MPSRLAAFHVLAKPVGPLCNLDCSYCYYLDKEQDFPPGERFRMREELLERFVRGYIEAQPGPEIAFAWQGGEPTLLGLTFFERAVELQRRYAGGKRITNALQTNGTLLDEGWCRFLRREGFLVGLSLDGPRGLHDAHRPDKRGRPSWERVMAGLELLVRHRVEFNTLTVVHRHNAAYPLEVYRFLRECGSRVLQLIPLVERVLSGGGRQGAGRPVFLPPPESEAAAAGVLPETDAGEVSELSVLPEQWGAFLCSIFDEWVRRDVGRVFVQQFDGALSQWLGLGAAICVHAETCGRSLALEHDGDVFACDHYVYPRWRLGNLAETPLAELVDSPAQQRFGAVKRDTLARRCRECSVRFACGGDCPKHRFIASGSGALSYLCAGYERFFKHIASPMTRMATLVRAGRAPAEIMYESKHRAAREWSGAERIGRNDPCPCSSGRKFKRCCGGGT